MKLDNDQDRKIIIYITYTVLLLIALYNFKLLFKGVLFILDLLSPFIVGLAIAFIINVLLRVVENLLFHPKSFLNMHRYILKIKRPFSLIVTLSLIFGSFLILIVIIVPELQNAFSILVVRAPELYRDFQVWFISFQEKFSLSFIPEISINWESIVKSVSEFISSGSLQFYKATTSVISSIVTISVGFVFAIYVLLQKEKLCQQVKKLMYAFLPKKFIADTLEVVQLSNSIFSKFIIGQCIEAFLIGLMCFVGMIVFGIPLAGAVSVLVGFTALIPILGAFIGTFIGMLLIATINPIQSIFFLIYIIVIQQIDGNIIYPKVVGSAIGLPGIWVLAAVTVGASLYGIIGMLIAVPLASVLYSILRIRVNRRILEKEITIT